MKLFYFPTFDKGADHHGQPTEEERERGRPSPAQPRDPYDGEQVSRQLHGGGDHEGEVELEVKVGDVPHCRVENAARDHPQENTEQTDPEHLPSFKKIQICVARSSEIV